MIEYFVPRLHQKGEKSFQNLYIEEILLYKYRKSKYLKNWISVIIWYQEIHIVMKMQWWRIVLRKCRRRTGFVNCGAKLGPVDILF